MVNRKGSWFWAKPYIWNETQESNGHRINFHNIGNDEWTKVCFLGPYNGSSTELLGFPWNVSEFTDVLDSDGHNVIVFSTENKVIDFAIQIRTHGDFHNVPGKCLSREDSSLVKDQRIGSFVKIIGQLQGH